MLRTDGIFRFGFWGAKLISLGADLSAPIPKVGGTSLATIRQFGGVGAHDFSTATPSSVPMTVKLDNGTPETINLDLTVPTYCADISAVTNTELVAAITAAGPFTGVLVTIDSRGYLQADVTTPGTQRYLQVYGLAAQLSGFGQGYGAQFVKVGTIQSLSQSPTMKDDQTFTITDGQGRDTEMIMPGYRKGFTGTLVDTASDPALRQLIEGGIYATPTYTPPNSSSEKKYFAIEAYRPDYAKGTSLKDKITQYALFRFLMCTGSVGDDPGDANFLATNYNIIGTEYTDPVSSTLYSDHFIETFTPAQWETLDWWNI